MTQFGIQSGSGYEAGLLQFLVRGLAGLSSPKDYPAPPPPTPETYRQMGRHPVIALGDAITLAPMLASSWSMEARDETVPQDRVEFARDRYERHRPFLLKQLYRGVRFGSRVLARVTEVDELGRLALKRFKALRTELTEFVIDKTTGDCVGVRQGRVEATRDQVVIYTHDMEDDDYRGVSLYENLRESTWWPALCLARNTARLENGKIVGVLPLWYYDPTPQVDRRGKVIADPAVEVERGLRDITNGVGIGIPNDVASLDPTATYQERVEASKQNSRNFIDVKDFGSSAGALAALVDRARYLDSNMMRGLLKPERMALEGQFGTKAEAGEHGDIGAAHSDELASEFAEVISAQSIDVDLAASYADYKPGDVFWHPAPIRDADKQFYRELVTALLGNPTAMDAMIMAIDRDALLDRAGVPKSAQTVDFDQIERELQQRDPNAQLTQQQKDLLDAGVKQLRPANEAIRAGDPPAQ